MEDFDENENFEEDTEDNEPSTCLSIENTQYNSSKTALIGDLKQTDFHGNTASTRGRYQPIRAMHRSLVKPDEIKEENEQGESLQELAEEVRPDARQKNTGDIHGSQVEASKNKQDDSTKMKTDAVTSEKNNSDEPDSVHRDSLVTTVTMVTNLMKWQLKSKKTAEANLKTTGKYKGHLEIIQRRGRQEHVELPFPIRLDIKKEILTIQQNIIKEYQLTLGKDHKLTKQAIAKEHQLQSELAGEDIFL